MKKPTAVLLTIFGILVVIAMIIASQYSPRSLPFPIGNMNGTSTQAKASGLPILAQSMPAFQGITNWWNTPNNQPLTPDELKGKVVLVDFWTYSCINCIRTYPFLKTMYDRYANDGLVIVGVHTPEFAFEADPANVGREIVKNGLKYPIALDSSYGTWNAYGNQYWPAEYLFDRQGRLRETRFGEGQYDQSEMAIRSLLAESPVNLQPMGPAVPTPDFSKIQTGETYFGLGRGDAFMGSVGVEGKDMSFTLANNVDANKWTAGGTWQFQQEYVQADSADAQFRFNVSANELHIVMASADGKDKRIEVTIDGGATQQMTINASTLYTVARFPGAGRHTVQIRIIDAGIRFYAATFS
jgi:thiol-disulfide isomerase/thioredoxin